MLSLPRPKTRPSGGLSRLWKNLVPALYLSVQLSSVVSARAGGGGGGGDGGFGDGLSGDGDAVLGLFVMLFLGVSSYLYFFYRSRKKEAKMAEMDLALDILEEYESSWNKDYLLEYGRWAFLAVQEAWTQKNRKRLWELMAQELFDEWNLMLTQMDRFGQWNRMDQLKVTKLELLDIQDYTKSSRDSFTAIITASAIDYTVDDQGEWTVPGWKAGVAANKEMSKASFTEIWRFVRSEEEWKLAKVDKSESELKYTRRNVILCDKKYGKEEMFGKK